MSINLKTVKSLPINETHKSIRATNFNNNPEEGGASGAHAKLLEWEE